MKYETSHPRRAAIHGEYCVGVRSDRHSGTEIYIARSMRHRPDEVAAVEGKRIRVTAIYGGGRPDMYKLFAGDKLRSVIDEPHAPHRLIGQP